MKLKTASGKLPGAAALHIVELASVVAQANPRIWEKIHEAMYCVKNNDPYEAYLHLNEIKKLFAKSTEPDYSIVRIAKELHEALSDECDCLDHKHGGIV